ncbi:MAG TPA: DUF2254 domain-containing protein [Sphingomicrobium sp.]|nr:DUF2254 domain-containing protein [Sphingomicrobium sp.]
MTPSVSRLLEPIRSSYWFVPSVMSVAAIALGIVTVWLDSGPAADWLDGLGWYQSVKPDGAHEVLSTIAGSMITVAGVVFSITIVAISFAASQYGPRILTNFMSDRGNQVTLGTFVATFLYCLVVLRTIRGGDEDFVPQLAVMVGLLFALASIGVLIYFIHHVTQSIHINTITSRVARQLVGSIERRFPACVGDPPDQSDDQRAAFRRKAEEAFGNGDVARIASNKDGYLQAVDDDRLLSIACEHRLLLRLDHGPGEFLYRGGTVLLAHPSGRVSEEIADELRKSWTVGSDRTPEQDILFLIDELVEIAARALSTGVNDPYSAMTCTNWLAAGLAEIARRQSPSPYRLDDKGELRLIVEPSLFDEHLQRGLGRLRPYAARDVNAATHFLAAIAGLGEQNLSARQRELLGEEADALLDLARRELDGPSKDRVEEQMAITRRALDQAEPAYGRSPRGQKDMSGPRQAAARPAAE